MIDILYILLTLAIGYLLGSLNTGVIVGRLYGKDIRALGSRNAGLTNTLRVLGTQAALLVLVGDILKGIIACLIGLKIGVYSSSATEVDCVSLLAAGAGAVIGHNWPLYFGFKGGKGVLTAMAVLFMFDWRMALICLGCFGAIVAMTRYVSLGTICGALLFLALCLVPDFAHSRAFDLFALLMVTVIITKHRTNIQRLLAGTESKLAC